MTVAELIAFVQKRMEIGDLDPNGNVIVIKNGDGVIEVMNPVVDGKDLLLELPIEEVK